MPRKGRSPDPRKPASAESPRTKRLSVPVAWETDVRLYAIAGMRGLSKEELAAELIEQGLRRYRADRAVREIASEVGSEGMRHSSEGMRDEG